MEIIEAIERPQQLVDQLVCIWERSVRASHDFLDEADVNRIGRYVPQAILGVARLVVAYEGGNPLAFLGAQDGMLEMLFVDAGLRGRGIGGTLLDYGVERLGVRELTVNEQNPAAATFYEARGFRTVARLEADGQGEPYPLLRMELAD